jgi:hypothetical protein
MISRLRFSLTVTSVAARKRASLRPTITSLSAMCASAQASARPIPDVTPVTTTVLAPLSSVERNAEFLSA